VEKATVILKVHGESSDEANLLVNTLIDELNTNVRGIYLDRKKEDPETLDPGTIIVAILGTQLLRPAEFGFQRDCLSRYQIGRVVERRLKHHEMSRV
jgi:hypothetical protein